MNISTQLRVAVLAICVAAPGLSAAQAQSVNVGYGFNNPPTAPSPTDSRISQTNLIITPAYSAPGTVLSFAQDAMDNSFGTDDGLITWSLNASSGNQINSMSGLLFSTSNRNFGSSDVERYQLWGAVQQGGVTSAYTLLSAGSITGLQEGPVQFNTIGTQDFSVFDNLGTGTAKFRLLLADNIANRAAPLPSWNLNQLSMTFDVAPVTAVPEPSTAALCLLGGLGLVALSRRRKAAQS